MRGNSVTKLIDLREAVDKVAARVITEKYGDSTAMTTFRAAAMVGKQIDHRDKRRRYHDVRTKDIKRHVHRHWRTNHY
jgi:hypothetical protein